VTFLAGILIASLGWWLVSQAVGRRREQEIVRLQAIAAQAGDREMALRLALDDARRGLIQARQLITQMKADEDRKVSRPMVIAQHNWRVLH
jgi:hypothetical protein